MRLAAKVAYIVFLSVVAEHHEFMRAAIVPDVRARCSDLRQWVITPVSVFAWLHGAYRLLSVVE